MTRLKDATFVTGTTTGSDAFTSVTGSPTIDTSSKLKGANSFAVSAAVSTFGRVSGYSEIELYISFYIYVTANPASNDRIVYITNGTSGLVRLVLTSAGRLQLQDGGGTNIGSTSSILSLNTAYRIGLHYKQGGGSDGIAELFLVAGDAAFGTAVTTTSAHNGTLVSTRFDVGNTNSSGGVAAFYVDNVRADTASMPTDDVAGGTDTPKTINVTVNNTLTVLKNVGTTISRTVTSTPTLSRLYSYGMLVTRSVTTTPTVTKIQSLSQLITYAVTSTLVFAKGMVSLKTISVSVSNAASVLKNIGKPILQTVSTTLTRNTIIPKNVLISCTVILFRIRTIDKIISREVTVGLTALVGRAYYRTAEVVANVSSVITKNIMKPIVMTQTVVASIEPKSIAKTIVQNVTVLVSSIHGNLVLKTIEYLSTVSVNTNNSVGKVFLYVQDTILTLDRSLTLSVERLIEVSISPSVQRNFQIIKTVFVNVVVAFSKLASDAFTNTYLRTNTRVLTLNTISTVLRVLGKNSRSIDLKDTNES